MRLAVALFKKINPSEIVFMSFINENRFDTDSTGWQVDIMTDKVWEEIEKICDSCIKPEQLGGDEVMTNIVSSGFEVMSGILKIESERNKEILDSSPITDEDVVYEEYEYYEEYYDPFYISPFWLIPLILW